MGFRFSSFNSSIATNSFSYMNNRAYAPFLLLNGMSRPQMRHQCYYQLANNGAGVGNLAERWRNAHGLPNISFK